MTETNKAIKELENLIRSFSPDADDNGGYTEIQSALTVALVSLRSQSEVEKKIEAVKEYCREQIKVLGEKTQACGFYECETLFMAQEVGYAGVLEFCKSLESGGIKQ